VILPMLRVELIGPRERFPAALAFLQRRGTLELRAPAASGVAPILPEDPASDAAEGARLEEQLRRIEALSARLAPSEGGRPEPVPPAGGAALSDWLGRLEGELGTLEARRTALVAERDATARFARLVVALAPLGHGIDPALEPEVHGVVLRASAAATALLEAEVRRISGGACEVKARPLDEGTTGVLVVVPRGAGAALASLLSEHGVDEVKLPPLYAGKRLVDVLFLLAARQRALPRELARAEAALAALAARVGPTLAGARESALWALERRRALARCGGTRFAFVIAGYVPAERVPALREEVAAELGPALDVFARPPRPSEWSDVPVVLRNRRPLRPFQRLLALVPLPRYGSIDPTPWLAVFFPLFFGLVLGDVAFGVLGIAVAIAVRRARWGGEAGRDLAWIALGCSVSAVVFGVLFGEALGELGAHAGLHPLLLDRRRAFLALLGVSIALGALHVAIGMALGIATAARRGRVRDAVGRAAKLLLLAAALVASASALSVLPRRALLPAVAACAVLLVAASIAGGPLALLELVLGLGNVLSYARLMALGLASVMLAEVANRLATSVEPAALGLGLGIFLHAVNFSLGLVSPAIAALRLQYVEFFEKFYDEGGFPFRPFGVASRAPGIA
jgi:V/A-type H+/Na+-transporting ATPase subunit I